MAVCTTELHLRGDVRNLVLEFVKLVCVVFLAEQDECSAHQQSQTNQL